MCHALIRNRKHPYPNEQDRDVKAYRLSSRSLKL
jgi:hypothetical protein